MIPVIRSSTGKSQTEAMSAAAVQWAHLSEAEKAPFLKLHEQDQKRHDKQVKELEEKGYFLMDDGTKSSDHVPKKKKSRKAKSESKSKSKSKSKSAKKVKKGGKKRASDVEQGVRSKGKSSSD